MSVRNIPGRIAAFVLLALASLSSQAITTYVVQFTTTLGNFDVWLFNDVAPNTVQNFLGYVNGGYYSNSFVYRHAEMQDSGVSVIQGGGYYWDDTAAQIQSVQVASSGQLANEFPFGRSPVSNVRSTIAMAQVSGNPDSATNEWFINLADNSVLDNFNLFSFSGPFVVFGEVLGHGMDVVDAIAALPIEDQSALNAAFGHMPLKDHTIGTAVDKSNLALIPAVSLLPVTVPDNYTPTVGTSGNITFLVRQDCYGVANLRTPDNPSPSDAPANIDFFEGFFSFVLVPVNNVTRSCIPSAKSDADVANGLPVFTADVLMQLPGQSTPNVYYRYGPTPDNHTPHWYNFAYDGRTGARFSGDKVLLSFVDGERGDDDLTVNGVIYDAGAPGIDSTLTSGGGGGAMAGWELGLLALAGLWRYCKYPTFPAMRGR